MHVNIMLYVLPKGKDTPESLLAKVDRPIPGHPPQCRSLEKYPNPHALFLLLFREVSKVLSVLVNDWPKPVH
jgi:hypothetical protein